MGHIIRISLGVIFIVIGVLSIFIPFLPGMLFLLAGLVLLGNQRAKNALRESIAKLKKWIGPKAGKLFLGPVYRVIKDDPKNKNV